jgi:hypothetical protein
MPENDRDVRRTLQVILIWYGIYVIIQTLNLILSQTFSWIKYIAIGFWFIPIYGGYKILLNKGWTRDELYLQYKPITFSGFSILILSVIFLPFIILSGTRQEFRFFDIFIDAPISGLTQELFFRSILMPVLIKYYNNNTRKAILTQTFLFSLWHIGVFWLAPWWAGLVVCVVPFLCGYAWGWQVQHDKTIIYTIIIHIVFLIIMSAYTWG